MTLRQKISWQIGAMLVGLLLVSGAAFWGIDALHQDYGVALDGYQRLRQAYGAGTRLATAQKLLQWSHPQAVAAARAEVQAALTDFEPLAAPAEAGGNPAAGWDAATAAQVRTSLYLIGVNLELIERSATGQPPPEAVAAQRDAIVEQLGRIASLSGGIRRATEAAQQAGDAKRRGTMAVLAALCSAVVLSAVGLGALHYRGVMRPIRRLTEGVRRLTAGQFKGRIDALGKDELATLAREFNRMAEELDGFYHQLEKKVADKSRELIRSERLASVGYLAAGVAHEINNPLGIISGYAEYSIAELERNARSGPRTFGASRDREGVGSGDAEPACGEPIPSDSDAGPASPEPAPSRSRLAPGEPSDSEVTTDGTPDEVARSLEIIRDEAFRCKAITQQLLSLARGGDDQDRRPVSLLAVANEVAAVVGGLRQHRDKRLVVRAADRPGDADSAGAAESSGRGSAAGPAAAMAVDAVEAEMKQVVLNLTVNALEAVPPGTGEVRIDVRSIDPPRRPMSSDASVDGDGGGDGGAEGKGDGSDRWVELSVADNGRGMSAATLERAFEPFFTEKRGARDDGRHGTGLGLSITHAIVQAHGGSIAAESDGPGCGSRFVVRLPAVAIAANTTAPATGDQVSRDGPRFADRRDDAVRQ